jgi:transcriptional regulator with XRE-family HTH domain
VKRLKKKIPMTRLAILRREMGMLQKELAERCALSTIYILKLEHGERMMTRNVALALSIATGASVEWLMGKGRRYPILTPAGVQWTPKSLEVHPIIWKRTKDGKREGALSPETINRYFDMDYCAGEAQFAGAILAGLCDATAKIIYSAYKKKKTMLVIRLIQEHLTALIKRFQVTQKWPDEKGVKVCPAGKPEQVDTLYGLDALEALESGKTSNDLLEKKMRFIAQHFKQGLEIEFDRRGDEYRAYLERQARKARQHSANKTSKVGRSKSR